MFSKAIVKTPSSSMTEGLSSAGLGLPDFQKALEQHEAYVKALKACGLEIIQLEADPEYPDACFIEDVALLTPKVAIITNPGAPTRQGEVKAIRPVLEKHYVNIESIQSPSTIEAGDIMMVGSHFYIGLSSRTNQQGANDMINILERYGMSGSVVPMADMLHLKTGVAYLERNTMVVFGEMVTKTDFAEFEKIVITADEAPAANCIWVNDKVLLPAGRPKAQAAIEKAGYEVVLLDVSEYEKLDGGLSCLSLRF